MNKYENEIWKLLNVDELQKKGRVIDYKKCIGITLKYKLKTNGGIYEIKILDYIKGYKENTKKEVRPK